MAPNFFVLHPKELEDLELRARRGRNPRKEKMLDFRSAGHRFWMGLRPGRKNGGELCPGKFSGRRHGSRGGGDRVFRTAYGNFLQEQQNRKARKVPLVDEDGEGVVPPYKKTVQWLLW